MLFISGPRRLVVQVPLVWLVPAVALNVQLARVPARAHWGTWILPVLLGLIALGTFRIVKRTKHQVVIWGVFERQRFAIARTFVAVLMRTSYRGGSVTVELMVGDKVDLFAPSAELGNYYGVGMDRPMRDARRIATALDLAPPRVAPWLDASEAYLGPETGKRRGRRSRWFVASIIGLAVLGLLAAFLAQKQLARAEAELYLRCRSAHAIKLPIGQLTLTGPTGFTLPPGEATIEVWNADLACWTQRTLTLKAGVKTILDLDDLAALRRCDRRGSPPP